MPDGLDPERALQKAADAAGSWQEPDLGLLEIYRGPAPELPIALFGEMAGWIGKAARATSAPPDFVALALLAHAAGSIGNSISVRPDPVRSPGWDVSIALWTALVGPPSSGKTPALKPFERAVNTIERAEKAKLKDEIAAWDAQKKIAQIAEKVWKKNVEDAIKAGEPVPEQPEAAKLPAPIAIPRLRVKDITVEKLADVLKQNPRGLLVFRDELFGWFSNMSRYSNGSDQPLWLEFYNGGTLVVDRKYLEAPTEVENALVSIIGGIQPDRLAETTGASDDGIHSRFLYTAPDIPPLLRADGAANQAVLDFALQTLFEIPLSVDQEGAIKPHVLDFDTEAADEMFRFRQSVRELIQEHDGLIAGWIGKADGVVARLAATLMLLDNVLLDPSRSVPSALNVDYLGRAVALWRYYFLPMAKRALSEAALPVEERVARRILREARRREAREINQRVIRREWAIEGLGKDTKLADKAFEVLKESGWVREADRKTSIGSGRPRKDWIINPRLFGTFGTFGTEDQS